MSPGKRRGLMATVYAALILACCWILAGCGSTSSDSASFTSTSVTTAGNQTINVPNNGGGTLQAVLDFGPTARAESNRVAERLSEATASFSLQIFSPGGQLLAVQNGLRSPGSGPTTVTFQGLAPGLVLVRLICLDNLGNPIGYQDQNATISATSSVTLQFDTLTPGAPPGAASPSPASSPSPAASASPLASPSPSAPPASPSPSPAPPLPSPSPATKVPVFIFFQPGSNGVFSMTAGSTQSFQVIGSFADGTQADVTAQASLSLTGSGAALLLNTVTAMSPGQVTLSAQVGQAFANLQITVVASGGGTGGFTPPPANPTPPAQIFVSDSGNSRIVGLANLSGTTFVPYNTGAGSLPAGIFVDSANRIYVVDSNNARILRMDDLNGANLVTFGTAGAGSGQFTNPTGVFVDGSNKIYVADTNNSRVVRMDDMSGTNFTFFGTAGAGIGQFSGPKYLSVQTGTNQIYISDTGNNRIVRVDNMAGANFQTFGTLGAGNGQFNAPSGLFLDATNHIVIGDTNNNRIVQIDNIAGANFLTLGGFNAPQGVAVDSAGHIYVADTGNNRLVRVDNIGGANMLTFGTFGSALGQFNALLDVFAR